MQRDLLQLIRGFSGLDVLVIGEAMLDAYLNGSADRLCREAPVPVVGLSERSDRPGGAANAAMNVAGLGAHVSYLGVVGPDDDGLRLRNELEAGGIDPGDLVVSEARQTLSKCRVFAAGQMLMRLDQGSYEPLDRAAEAELIGRLSESFERADLIIVSDYGYGVVTPQVIEALERLMRRNPRPLVVDAKYPERYRRLPVTAVKPNYGEVARLLGLSRKSQGRIEQLEPFEDQLLEATGARIVAATLDEEGALVFERSAPPYRTYSRPMPHSNATGAGDTYTAALALALAAGADTPGAAECASAAARLVVSKDGTTVCRREELLAWLGAGEKILHGRGDVATHVEALRKEGRRIVFTNGCFDILHRGHVTCLSRAKALGDVLIVGINGDAGVRALKGPERPINPLEDRVQVLSALSCVDHIVPFDEPTPAELLKLVRPDVFVKGGDYSEESLPEASLVKRLGGRVELLPYLDGRSTTGIIERVRGSDAEAPRRAAGGGPA
ncbi:MAG TPA: D-glycero-beta-D-manno-heptose 1-phosphate adenylyltransferase [Trueperaceae bacterium]